MNKISDNDPLETQEWREALASVLEFEGPGPGALPAGRVVHRSPPQGHAGAVFRHHALPQHDSARPGAPASGNRAIEHKIRSLIRWNALAIVLRANKESSELGGHIASFQSAATLYDTGFQHFWNAQTDKHGGDLVYIQGHSSPGIYARAFLEGRLSEEQLLNFRQEVDGKGVSSYPHPWLMPDFWQFPTVSMGLGPLMAIYQARFLRYLHGRGLADTAGRKVWCFLGDGETDEPESLGAIGMAGRERLDNLVFVVNCNLQRLDGPVRGNGKIIQELEGVFRGAGWNVIKTIWGSGWDPLIARDTTGILLKRMEECVDGEFQDFKSKNGAYVREHFFGKDPVLKARVAGMSDEQIWSLTRGGHDPSKVYAAYAAAVAHKGQPTVILAKTVKGYGMGEAGEGQNITHQQKKMGEAVLKEFRDRFSLPVTDEQIKEVPFLKLAEDSPEMTYLRERRAALGGSLPARRAKSESLQIPPLSTFDGPAQGTGGGRYRTTMAFVRILNTLPARQEDRQARRADRARRVAHLRHGGHVPPVRHLQPGGPALPAAGRRPAHVLQGGQGGQILQEGINEPGAIASWIAAATSYSTSNVPMIPFYIYYSMFGFQRSATFLGRGDMRAAGFLIGGTAGRTTLNGEGLQHEDGHSHIFSSVIPNCVSYDPDLLV
jgi:pyruvate dehydrogenase E1 component